MKNQQSDHFTKRMYKRSINREMVDITLKFGEEIYARNSMYFFMSRKIVSHLPLKKHEQEKLDGLTLVLNPKTLDLITCFRNPDFKRKIKYKN